MSFRDAIFSLRMIVTAVISFGEDFLIEFWKRQLIPWLQSIGHRLHNLSEMTPYNLRCEWNNSVMWFRRQGRLMHQRSSGFVCSWRGNRSNHVDHPKIMILILWIVRTKRPTGIMVGSWYFSYIRAIRNQESLWPVWRCRNCWETPGLRSGFIHCGLLQFPFPPHLI